MTNPDGYIRLAYLSLGISVPMYVDEVPINVTPIPANRVILSTQTKRSDSTSQCGHTWDCSILLDIICEQQKGFSNRDVVDNIEQEILSAVPGIAIPPFTVEYTNIQDAHSSNLETPTKTITRKLLRVTHKLNYL